MEWCAINNLRYGGQSRAFIHISDTATCVQLALENDDFESSRVRIFNQVAEVHTVLGLAKILEHQYGEKLEYRENPRKELAENELEVSKTGLVSLGFTTILLNKSLVDDVRAIAEQTSENFERSNVMSSPNW